MMPAIHAYKCRLCDYEAESFRNENPLMACPNCSAGALTKNYQVAVQRPMSEHFNETVGQPIASMREFKEALKRGGDEFMERTGQTVDYQPRDWSELGGTNEHLDSTNRVRVAAGQKPLWVP